MGKFKNKTVHQNQVSFDRSKNLDKFNLIQGALSGTSGGALLGAPFGIVGSIIGSIIAGLFTGYSSYRDELNRINNQKIS